MKGKDITIDVITLKKNYCHKCGGKMKRLKRSRFVTPDDPDYKKHVTRGRSIFHCEDIDVIHYDLICTCCKNEISADEQRIARLIQKKLDNLILTDEQIKQHFVWAKKKSQFLNKVGKTLWICFLAGIVLLICFLGKL